jgi:hypothetical protein
LRGVAPYRTWCDDTRAALSAQADAALETRVTKLLGTRATETDPLDVFKPQVRSAYQHVISLIYDLASNSAAAAALVDKTRRSSPLCAETAYPGGVHGHPRPSQALAFGSSVPQASSNALRDQAALQFGHSAQDGENPSFQLKGSDHFSG